MQIEDLVYQGYLHDIPYENLQAKDELIVEVLNDNLNYQYSLMIFEEDRKYGEWRKIGSFIITEGQVLSDLYSMIEHTRLLIQMEIPLRFPNESIAVDEVLSIDSISQIVGHILPNQ